MKSKKNVSTSQKAEKIRKAKLNGHRNEEIGGNGQTPRLILPVGLPSLHLSTRAPLSGSLPLDFRESPEGGELVPAVVFAPPHLHRAEPLSLPPPSTAMIVRDVERAVARSSAMIVSDSSALTTTENGSTDDEFLKQAEGMLNADDSTGMASQFKASATDPSYDFDEYIFLRNTDDPYAEALPNPTGNPQPIPSDPRYQRFIYQAENGIYNFVQYVLQEYFGGFPGLAAIASGLELQLMAWWRNVCAIRAFNRLGRYSRSEIKKYSNRHSSEEYYGLVLGLELVTTATMEVRGYLYDVLATGNVDPADPTALGKLLTVEYWEGVLTSVFQTYFDENGIGIVDPTAPEGDYPFEPFLIDDIFFGLQTVHRQTWHLLGYARGELVKSIPLGPKESQKISVKILRRTKMTRTTEEATSSETTSETSNTTKNTSEVVAEASEKLNRHAEAEVSGGYLDFIKAKVSGGLSEDLSSSSKQTKSRLNEQMEKTASRMKRDTKVVVSTEREESFEETRSSELINPNDEVAVTYLYHRLQQRYWVSTEISEVNSVVFVPEPLPDWGDVDENWVRQHGEIITGALLDASYAPILAAIRREPATLAYAQTAVFGDAASAGIEAAKGYKGLQDGGSMPDLLTSGQQFYERDFERRNNLSMDQMRRAHQSEALLTHIRRNILHYMRAIWSSEDYDQRMQRFNRMRVPTEWVFVPRVPLPSGAGPASPLEVEGVFMPDVFSALPLTEVIHPIGPIGFLFNCAIYQLRDNPKLVNLHQALAYLRAAYTRFGVTITISQGAGVTLRQVVALSPRSFLAEYTLTYRTNGTRWLIPRANLPENQWFEVRVLPDGSLDALGLRIWLDGAPVDQATLTVKVRSMGELEDPHLRLVQILNPLPAVGDELQVFTESLLREMITVLPELTPSDGQSPKWDEFTEAQKSKIRESYHRFLMLRECGRLVTLDTANVVLDLEISRTPALEQFKRLHRYVDVLKEYQELRRRALDNTRREELMKKGLFGDPDIERVTFVGARDDIKDVVALPDGSDE